jgi:hypothetical protein
MIFADAQSSIQSLHDNAQLLIAQSANLHKRIASATGLQALTLKVEAAAVDAKIAPAVAAEAAAITAAKAAGITPTIVPTVIPTAADVGISGQTILLVVGVGLAAWFGIKKLREKN